MVPDPAPGASLPVQLALITWNADQPGAAGGIQKWRTDTENIWVAIVNAGHRRAEVVAALLAGLLVDHAEQVFHPSQMPGDPASALLRAEGSWQPARGRTLPGWAAREMERVAGVLRSEHAPFLQQAVDALHGNLAAGFRRPDRGFAIRDETGCLVVVESFPNVAVDLRESDRVGKGLDWNQVVRLDYRRDRFMRHLTDEQLERRLVDLVANMTGLTPMGLVSMRPPSDELAYWLARFSEVTEEIALRYGPFPNGFTQGRIGFRGFPGSLDPRNLGRPTRFLMSRSQDDPVVVKYGEARFLRPALERGQLRVSPASTYADPSLNAAIQADEHGAEIEFAANVLPTPEIPGIELPTRVWLKTTRRVASNYYVYCTSSVFDLRLLFDFGADCCIVVHDPQEFSRRLLGAMEERLPGWTARTGEVEYFDPLQVTPQQVRLPMAKHFRYAYQREHRFVWLPPDRRDALEPIYVELGPLSDIAELVSPCPVT